MQNFVVQNVQADNLSNELVFVDLLGLNISAE